MQSLKKKQLLSHIFIFALEEMILTRYRKVTPPTVDLVTKF